MKKFARGITLLLIAILGVTPANAHCEEGVAEVYGDAFNNRDLRSALPMSYDPEEAEGKGLAVDGAFTDHYFELQAFYAKALWGLLDDKCKISELDAQLCESEEHYIPEQKHMSVYQKHWSFGSSFFFLRNNLHMENLTAEQLDALNTYMGAGDADSEQVRDFIVNTFSSVIRIFDNVPAEENYDVVYEMSGLMAPHDALVLGLATGPEYDENGNYVDVAHEARKAQLIAEFAERTEASMTEAMGMPVTLFVYP